MKRYGYKFYPLSGGDTAGIDIRFWSILLAFVGGVLSFVGDGQEDSFFLFSPLAILYFVLGSFIEYWQKVFSFICMLVALLATAAYLYFLFSNIGECIEYCSGFQRDRGVESKYFDYSMAIYLSALVVVYNGILFILSYGSYRSARRN